ncbi:MAG: transcriptional repressor LexA [Chloroflexi bacterium]|nr:transcriptional repressor LexA [Chloroflexota bacterium]
MKLRPRQKRILEFIQEYIDEHDYPPTIREIGAAVGISSTSVVNYNLERLEEMKLIERNREVSRGLRLVKPKDKRGGERVREIPLYGKIAAGKPIPIPDDPETVAENIAVPASLLPTSGEAFALRVEGHSMIDALVNDGDIIVVRSQPEVENGQMAVVEVLEPAELAGVTLKRFYRRDDKIELRPDNPDPSYQPFWVEAEHVRVYGRVESVLRKYS